MGFAFYIPEFDGFLLGNVLLALGGTCIFVPSFSIANAFPKYSGTIVATVTGAFDASAAVFLFYRLAYERSAGAFTPHKFFTIYLAVPVLILIGQLTLMNEDAYKTVAQLESKIEKQRDATQDVSLSPVLFCVSTVLTLTPVGSRLRRRHVGQGSAETSLSAPCSPRKQARTVGQIAG